MKDPVKAENCHQERQKRSNPFRKPTPRDHCVSADGLVAQEQCYACHDQDGWQGGHIEVARPSEVTTEGSLGCTAASAECARQAGSTLKDARLHTQ